MFWKCTGQFTDGMRLRIVLDQGVLNEHLRDYNGGKNMAALHLTTENFRKEVLEYGGVAMVDFWASWCGPCQMVGPVIEEIAAERTDVKVCKVNVDEQPDIEGKYNVMSIPTIIVFKNGEPAKVSVGAKPKAELLALLA